MGCLWDKGEPLDELVLRFTAGEDPELDGRLVPYDVRASTAHARMLHEQGHLSAEDLAAVTAALEDLAREHAEGAWHIPPEEEDVHTALENRLVERVGDAGLAIHLGRSRNDQVLAALRLYMKDAVADLLELGRGVTSALDGLAAEQGGIVIPGYSHLQRAMPSTVALWAGGFRAEVQDDLEGLKAALRRADRNPLGSAAGYGVPVVTVDRARTAELLGFSQVQEPVTAVQVSRGKAEASVLFELTLLTQDLGRLAADVVLFATTEFGLVTLPAEMTTGSSIMPQKRNPDVFELVRARASEVAGQLFTTLRLPASLPSGYHRDLQLLKAPLYRGLDTAADVLRIMAHALPGLRFQEILTQDRHDPDLYATERAYRLVVEEGLPFREAYRREASGGREEGAS